MKIEKYRGCILFAFEQINKNTDLKRIIVYGDDLIMHPGGGFATTLGLIKSEDIIESVKSIDVKFADYIFFV